MTPASSNRISALDNNVSLIMDDCSLDACVGTLVSSKAHYSTQLMQDKIQPQATQKACKKYCSLAITAAFDQLYGLLLCALTIGTSRARWIIFTLLFYEVESVGEIMQ